MTKELSPKSLLIDKVAASADPSKPAFLARPEGAPAYYGFPLVEATRTEGWCFGAITQYEDADGCEWGDGYVETHEGERAGLVWATDVDGIQEILPPDELRWGVYSVRFSRPVKTLDDLIANFRDALPGLQQKYREVKAERQA